MQERPADDEPPYDAPPAVLAYDAAAPELGPTRTATVSTAAVRTAAVRTAARRGRTLPLPDDGPRPTPLDVLHRVFGYESFRGAPAEVIDTLVAGGDALVLMPTGGGQSLCYQIPALVRPGTGVAGVL